MANPKKRPSKSAKAARKIIENSKLLAKAKTINAAKADQTFKPEDTPIKTSGPNKARPHKKRG